MWVIYKKRKIERSINKRKRVDNKVHLYNMKKQKISIKLKRKSITDMKSNDKKQKLFEESNVHNCLIHDEMYICNIYECSGIKDIKPCEHMPCEHMPYII